MLQYLWQVSAFLDPWWEPERSYDGFVRSSVCSSGRFLRIGSLVFLNFGMLLKTRLKWCVTAIFFRNFFFFTSKWAKGPKIGFFKIIEKFGHFFLNLFYNESLYYLLCSCANPIFGKNLVLEIWVKILSTNQIAEFLYQQYLQNKSMK